MMSGNAPDVPHGTRHCQCPPDHCQQLHLANRLMVVAPGIPACFEHTETTTADSMTDTRTSLAILSDQLADAAATAGDSIVAVHARPRLPSTGIHWQDG